MKRLITASKDNYISAMDLGDEYYDNFNGLVDYLNSLPVGTQLSDIVSAPGSHWAGQEAICRKEEGYETVYYNRYGLAPSDTKYKDTYWKISGSKIPVQTLAKIILDGNRYYCTADAFEDDL